jgi:hypothetical protein
VVAYELLRQTENIHVWTHILHLCLHKVTNNSRGIIVVAVLYNHLNKIDLRQDANERSILIYDWRA